MLKFFNWIFRRDRISKVRQEHIDQLSIVHEEEGTKDGL